MKIIALLCINKNKAQVYIIKNNTMSRNSYSLSLRQIMWQAWAFVKRNGFTLSEALKQAWALYRLHKKMIAGIVKF